MEGFEKGFSPSRSNGSGENNENDSSQDNIMNPTFQTHKKIVAKHFMSPTISAASKAAAPRRKILAERSENSSNFDAQSQTMSNHEMRKSQSVSYFSRSPSRIVSSNNHASDNDRDANVVAKSVKDYDPLTNYLSPRPKYLRFNPNRRLEIFDRLEKDGREDLNRSLDSEEFNDGEESSEEEIKDSSFSPPKGIAVNEKNEENTEEDDDYDEEEEEEEDEELEERGWCLKGVLKLLVTLIACLLSTSYICSMNSPTPSPTQQAISNLKDGYLIIKKQTLEVIALRMHDAGFLEVEVGDSYDEVEEVENDDDDNGKMEESIEMEVFEDNVEYLDRRDNVVGNEKEGSEDKIDEIAENDDDDNGKMEESIEMEVFEDNVEYLDRRDNVVGNEKEGSEDKIDEIAEIEVVRGGENDDDDDDKEVVGNEKEGSEDKIDEIAEIEVVRGGEIDDDDDDDNGKMEENIEMEVFENNVEYSDRRDNVVGNEKEGSEDKIDETAEIEVVRGGELVFEADIFEQLVAAKADESGSLCVEKKVESSYPVLDEDNVAETDEGEDSCGYGLQNELEGSHQLQELELLVKPISKVETPQESKGVDEIEPLELIGSHEKLTLPVPEVDETGNGNEVIIGVSVATILLTSLAIVYRSKNARNVSAHVEEEKVATPALPLVKKKIKFFSRPLLSHAMEDASREISHHIGAPHVELIGEIVVGQMSSRKHEMTESEKNNATFSDSIQPSQLEYSTTTSYGSFTAETKILKKEGGQSGEAMIEVTPVRRSSRLRNRAAAMSP